MIRVFKHYLPTPLLVLGLLEFIVLVVSAELGWRLRVYQINGQPGSVFDNIPEIVTFGIVMYVAYLAVGAYQASACRSVRESISRVLVASGVGLIGLSVIFFLVPIVALWRSVLLIATMISILGVFCTRVLFSRLVVWDRFRRRIIVLGAGARAGRVGELASQRDASFNVAAYVRMAPDEIEVEQAVDRSAVGTLAELVEQERAEEVVLAMKERRGALPLQDLLATKVLGTRIYDLSSFLERETGRVDLDSVSLSWLIFSDGFLASHRMSAIFKRLFDITASALLLIVTMPILLLTALAIKLTSPGPVFYRQERVGLYGATFRIMKFRSMRTDAEKDGTPQWAQKSDPRVTTVGKVIRATRIDEIPQIFNVFKGDMSFVGPRPERPFFVDELQKEIPLYAERHIVKPGITGWAQLNYPYGASTEDARHKLEYDLYYVKNYTVFLDILILIQTVRVVLWQDGVR